MIPRIVATRLLGVARHYTRKTPIKTIHNVCAITMTKPIVNSRVMVISKRVYSTTNKETVGFDDVQQIIRNKDTSYTLVDVREPSEVIRGSIPSAKNIPLSKILAAWTMSPEEFEEEYGFERPTEQDKIVVFCQAGIRSKSAADFLREIGYKRVLNYPGSYADYASKSQ